MNKQAEEIAKILDKTHCGDAECEECKFKDSQLPCFRMYEAEALHDAGYRKPEWISVEDDTPKNSLARVQVFLRSDDITDGIGFPKIDTDRYIDGKWVRWGKCVTHWMPLPMPPKGDETDA